MLCDFLRHSKKSIIKKIARVEPLIKNVSCSRISEFCGYSSMLRGYDAGLFTQEPSRLLVCLAAEDGLSELTRRNLDLNLVYFRLALHE